MRRLLAVAFGMLLGGAIVYVAYQYHVVRAGEKEFLLVPKQQAALTDAYVDIRQWDATEWAKHPELVVALTRHGRADLIKRAAEGWFQEFLRSFDHKVLSQGEPSNQKS